MSSINPSSRSMGSPERGRSQSKKMRAASRSESPQSVKETDLPYNSISTKIGSPERGRSQSPTGSAEKRSPSPTSITAIDSPPSNGNAVKRIQTHYSNCNPLNCFINKQERNVKAEILNNSENPDRLSEIISGAIDKVSIDTIVKCLINYEVKDLEKIKITKDKEDQTVEQSLISFAVEINAVKTITKLHKAGYNFKKDLGRKYYDENGKIKEEWKSRAFAKYNLRIDALSAFNEMGVWLKDTSDDIILYNKNGDIIEEITVEDEMPADEKHALSVAFMAKDFKKAGFEVKFGEPECVIM